MMWLRLVSCLSTQLLRSSSMASGWPVRPLTNLRGHRQRRCNSRECSKPWTDGVSGSDRAQLVLIGAGIVHSVLSDLRQAVRHQALLRGRGQL